MQHLLLARAVGVVRIVGIPIVIILVATPATVAAQDPFTSARQLYTMARYDEALGLLDALVATPDRPPPAALRDIEEYRAYCLLALGRHPEAEAAIAAVVTSEPTYRPDQRDASPRVRAIFREVRRRLLPDVARAWYADARAAFDREDHPAAAAAFDRLLALFADEDMEGQLADLRTLASGFRALSAAALAPPPPPQDATIPIGTIVALPLPPPAIFDADDVGVVAPQPLEQELPRLPREISSRISGRGVVEVVIDERGAVEAAFLRRPVHALYDPLVLEAARRWRYTPALSDGRPVKYRKVIHVTLNQPSSPEP